MSPDEIQKAKNDLEARLAAKGKSALPICEAAYMADGQVLIGYTNRDEDGGFTPLGDVTAWTRRREAQLADLQEDVRNLRNALFGSVTLQAHYAELLNQWDGGERLTFSSPAEWMARLMSLPGRSLLTENAMRAVQQEAK